MYFSIYSDVIALIFLIICMTIFAHFPCGEVVKPGTFAAAGSNLAWTTHMRQSKFFLLSNDQLVYPGYPSLPYFLCFDRKCVKYFFLDLDQYTRRTQLDMHFFSLKSNVFNHLEQLNIYVTKHLQNSSTFISQVIYDDISILNLSFRPI